jgi:hypothetical protein
MNVNEVKDQLMHNYLLKVHTLKHGHPRHARCNHKNNLQKMLLDHKEC